MQIDAKKFFFALFFFIATLVSLGYYHFNHEKTLINQNINSTLQKAVESANVIIGDSYHDRVLTEAPSDVEDADMLKTLTTFADVQGVKHIYSLVLDNTGKLRFTSSSIQTQEPNGNHNLTHFFDIYPNNPDMIKALKTNQIVWTTKERSDQLGKFRSLFIPYTTPSGYRYLIGADIEIGSIQKLSNAAAFNSISTSLIIFLGVLPFLLMYRNTLQDTATFLRAKVLSATDELREVNEILETKVEEKTKQLISQSFEDTLTELPNRHRLQYDMDRYSYNALIIINLHNFREINDFFGFSIGDDLLKQMGRWLKTVDLNPYRLSGDEFAILIDEELDQAALEELCQRLLNRLLNHPFNVGEETISLSITIGIDAEPELSLTHADIALHQAKEMSSHIAFYSSENRVEEQYQANIALTSTIHKALNAGRITCFYQPIVSTQTGRIEKYETLVRMIDESANIIAPLDFIKTAQKTRLYPQITRTVIEHSCNTFKNRTEEFSVNLSVLDIEDHNTVRFIEEMIVKTNTANRIVFEILESEGIDNFETVIQFIHRMKSLGAKIAIDDYGTGYSSLENVLRLDIDYLKIDGSLIRNINENPKHAIVLESIADFAAKLGIKTIAEFVSTEELYHHVKTIGITYSQGYYTGKPAALSL